MPWNIKARLNALGSSAFNYAKGTTMGRQLQAAGANVNLRRRVYSQHLRAAFVEESYLLAIDKQLIGAMKTVGPEVKAELNTAKQALVGAQSEAITIRNIQYQITGLESDIKKINRLVKLEKTFTGLNAYAPKIIAEKNQLVNELHTLFVDTTKRIATIDAQLEWLYKVTARLQLTKRTVEAEHTQIYQYIRYARSTVDKYRSVLAKLNRLA